ncbi:MAG: YVTN family beta-propeller repeat protein [Methanosarcina sp.]
MKIRENRNREKVTTGLFNSESAASTVIAAVLLLSIIFTIFAIVRIAYVPEWKNDAEQLHMSEVQRDMTELKSTADMIALKADIVALLKASNSNSSPIDFSVTVPISMGGGEIPILEPSKSSGTLSVNTEPCNVTITTEEGRIIPINSSTITYRSNNRQYVDQVFRYENGALILAQGDRSSMMQFPSLPSITNTSDHNYNVSIQAINVTGDPDSISSDTDTSLRLTGGPLINTLLVKTSSFDYVITTKYPDAWKSYFNGKLKGIATKAGLNYGTDFIIYSINDSDKVYLSFRPGKNNYSLNISESVITAEIGARNSFNYTTGKHPRANFNSTLESDDPLSLQFTYLPEGATEWIWDFGDGFNSTEQNPRHNYSAVGNYKVRLIASNVNGTESKEVTINITKATPTITWNEPADITYGTVLKSTQLDASAWFGTKLVTGTFVYNPTSGTTLNIGTHKLNVDFTPADVANYTTASKNVTINITKATPTITWNSPADIIYGTALNSIHLDAIASVNGPYTYTPASGTVLSAGAQTLNVDFTPTDNTNYSNVSKNVTINVMKATPAITWSEPDDIVYGTALGSTQLNASASVSGTLDYTPQSEIVLSAGAQTLNVDFTPTDNTNYSNVSKNVTVNVLKATSEIAWSKPYDIIYGTALNKTQLNAVASLNGTNVAGNYTYIPAEGTVLPVDMQNLNVLFTPDDAVNYTNATANVKINVTIATPKITWNKPVNIIYGTALSSTQLNATVWNGLTNLTSQGTLTYNPELGTGLPVGKQQNLNVLFTPDDAVNYTNATANVEMNVTIATPTIIWNNPADIKYGTNLSSTQLNATVWNGLTNLTSQGTLTYNPELGTGLPVGKQQNLNVLFTPDDAVNYTNATANVEMNVTIATPTIIWNNPADIKYGTNLSSTQLNATAWNGLTNLTSQGTFTYTPESGTVMNATQTLHVDFTSEDTANYSNASKDVTINVLLPAYAYITNTGSNNVSVIDTATNKVIDNVDVGTNPSGVAVTPNGTKVYVTNKGSKKVSVINTATNKVIDKVDVETSPSGVAVTPDGTKVYVANGGSSTVSVIDTTKNKVIYTVDVETSPVGVAVNPEGTKVYVTNFGILPTDGSVSVIDTATNEVTYLVSIIYPYGVAVSSDGTKMYVTSYYSNTVSVIDTATNKIIDTISVGLSPYGIALSPDGTKVYVVNQNSNTLSVIDTTKNKVIDKVDVGTSPVGVAVNPDGTKVYVANQNSDNVSVIDMATNKVTATVKVGKKPIAFGQFIASPPI